jgi:hypothetical protein
MSEGFETLTASARGAAASYGSATTNPLLGQQVRPVSDEECARDPNCIKVDMYKEFSGGWAALKITNLPLHWSDPRGARDSKQYIWITKSTNIASDITSDRPGEPWFIVGAGAAEAVAAVGQMARSMPAEQLSKIIGEAAGESGTRAKKVTHNSSARGASQLQRAAAAAAAEGGVKGANLNASGRPRVAPTAPAAAAAAAAAAAEEPFVVDEGLLAAAQAMKKEAKSKAANGNAGSGSGSYSRSHSSSGSRRAEVAARPANAAGATPAAAAAHTNNAGSGSHSHSHSSSGHRRTEVAARPANASASAAAAHTNNAGSGSRSGSHSSSRHRVEVSARPANTAGAAPAPAPAPASAAAAHTNNASSGRGSSSLSSHSRRPQVAPRPPGMGGGRRKTRRSTRRNNRRRTYGRR